MPLVLNMSLGCSCDIGLQQHSCRNGILSYSLDIQYTWSSSSTPVSWKKWELPLNCQTTEMIPQCYLRMGVVPGSNITHPTRSYQVAIHFVKEMLFNLFKLFYQTQEILDDCIHFCKLDRCLGERFP